MTWTAVGSFGDVQAGSFTLTPTASGNLIIADVANFSNSTVFASSVSSPGVTWTAVGHYLGVTNTGTHTLFIGTVTSTAGGTFTITWSGTAPAGIQIDYHEFHSTFGAWTVDTFTHLDSTGTTTWASMTAAGSGELYWGYAFDATSAASGSSSGFVYNVGPNTGNGQAYNLSSSGTAPVWGDGGQQLGVMLLVREQSLVTYPPALLLQPPGWFPGSDLVTGDPDGIPFYAVPAPADATPALIIPPTPEPDPVRAVPPGWFPGADGVTTEPGGIPFQQAPPPLNPAPAIIYPFPELDGTPDWLPLPPGYFPGSQTVTVDPGGIPFYAQPVPLLPAGPPPALPYITGLSGGTGVNRHFVDQYGNPRIWLAGEEWALPSNAGNLTSIGGGTWQQDFQTLLSVRAAQGYTVISVVPFGNSIFGGHDDGTTWDNVAPFTSNFNVFNETFWTRIDFLLSLAAQYGITINLDVAYSYCFGSLGGTGTGTLFNTMTLSQATGYGTTLGNRYKNVPNLIWMFGDDDNNNSTLDGLFVNIAAAIRATGDTHEMSIEYYPSGTTSHRDLSSPTGGTPFNFGTLYATYNWVYNYWTTYYGVEDAYADPTAPLPVVQGDGYFYGDTGTTAGDQQIQRNMCWWAFSSGAIGFTGGDEATLRWNVANNSIVALKTDVWPAQQAFVVRQLLEPLPFWKLRPDVNSVLVTSGRGTHAAYNTGQFRPVNSPDGYVPASYAADGSLALIYCDAAFTITINQSVMAPGYTATWVDPSNGTQTPTTTGSTYLSSGLGSNAAGNADWLLVLQGTLPVPSGSADSPVIPLAPGWFPGADLVTVDPGGVPFYTLPVSDAVTPALLPVAGAATLSGTGSLTTAVTQGVIDTLGGAGSLTNAATQGAGALLGGTGSVGDTAVAGSGATLAAAGSLTNAVTQGVVATLSGTGSLTTAVTLGAGATLSGTGSITAAVTQGVIATLSGTGSINANAGGNQSGAATLSGTGSLTDAGGLGSGGTIGGAGSLGAPLVTLSVAATLSGTGSLVSKVTLGAAATLTGIGSLTATGGGAIHNAVSNPAVTAGRNSVPAVTASRMSSSTVTQKAAAVPTVSGG